MEELSIILLATLPALLGCWLLPEDYQIKAVGMVSFFLLAYLDALSLAVLVTTSIFTYYTLDRLTKEKLAILVIGTILAVIFLFFKVDFASPDDFIRNRALPLGMSYYIFRQLHFCLEVYKGNINDVKFASFMSYLFFFPVFLVGPINRYPEWEREIRRRRWDADVFSLGLERILYGYVKIVILGNYFISNGLYKFIFNLGEEHKWLASYLDCIRYAANSYFQFAGYSDIAIGISLLMGIRVVENFNFPFLAININDFWKRWHISLSQWCKDYIFLPIASYTRMPIIAIVSSMLVLGLWHEVSMRYVIWGIFHGIGIAAWQLFDKHFQFDFRNRLAQILWRIVSVILTFNFVVVSFAWIKEGSFIEALGVFRTLLFLN
ncbi:MULTISPECIES: MBOAT family O-acyltransferase [unclassified Imperialibacter]|uniref:MBOAT family O-acyltransferase n=1 Tax=unclassified Imperialibacter TaxID=2629706 RepID=UPI001254CE81|nr:MULTISPECIES: MBOAT family O-acyltransferase [unclassified Imperialibacter]CAD5276508.1 Alginate O-acetyltransferase complex protein AlgI [Imperialibacter sp. 75]CAD5294565.1 Alginate O-acetyltransferase complex protein AlgI [Imperialibacter sp. 89]VVT12460.1 Alginate O-acetyltransferase complex protein AlgI [Imperialibacter sp. EC-SDR9]